MKIHYAGEIRNGPVHILAGWAACCSGDRARAIRRQGNHSYAQGDVTCLLCVRLLRAAETQKAEDTK